MRNLEVGQIVKVKKEPPILFPNNRQDQIFLKEHDYIVTIKQVYSKSRLIRMEETVNMIWDFDQVEKIIEEDIDYQYSRFEILDL